MPSPVRLSPSRRILSRAGSRSSTRSSRARPFPSTNSATPHASDDDEVDDLSNQSFSRSGSHRSNSPLYSRSQRNGTPVRSSRCRSSRDAVEDVQKVRQWNPVRTKSQKRTRFGLRVPANERKVIGDFDFEEKYPDDPIYEELGPNARVWRANLDECEVYDNDMVTEARDGLDLLLVFAGLFSAVLTTFVAQTSQALSNNFPAITTALLLEMVTLQRALINGTSIDNVSFSEMSSGPSGFDVWVNVLWFISLTLSLGTALMAVLVKQWLYQYMSIVSGTARDRSLVRFYRCEGLEKWHVMTIIGILPIVLHIALGVFLAGLIVFLIPLNLALASVVGFITLVIYSVYVISNILPVLYVHCPYRTPFSEILNVLSHPIFAFISSARTSASDAQTSGLSDSPTHVFRTLKDAERIAATGDDVVEDVACDALLWIYKVTSNPPTKSIVLQSVGCLSDKFADKLAPMRRDIMQALEQTTQVTADGQFYKFCSILPGQEGRTERLARAHIHAEEPALSNSEAYTRWKLDTDTFKPPFPVLTSILAQSQEQLVGDVSTISGEWSCDKLLVQILQEYDTDNPILLPSPLWRQLFKRCFEQSNCRQSLRDNADAFVRLCNLALQAHPNLEQADTPFSGGVPITHGAVPLLKFVTRIFPYSVDIQDVGSKSLQYLLTISDLIVSIHALPPESAHSVLPAIPTLDNVWTHIGRQVGGLSEDDSRALCNRAEVIITQILNGDWIEVSNRDAMVNCYASVISVYRAISYTSGTIPSCEFFTKIFSDFCLSSLDPFLVTNISSILQTVFTRISDPTYYPIRHHAPMDYYTVMCQSPLFTLRTNIPLGYSSYSIYPIVAMFVTGLAASHPDIISHCMEYLCAEPNRVFSVCRLLALGDNYPLDILRKFASTAPSHAIWETRGDYMNMDPQDWLYFHLKAEDLDNEEAVTWVKGRMQDALRALDDFFDNLAPPDQNTMATTRQGTETGVMLPAGSRSSPWKTVQRLMSVVRLSAPASRRPNGYTTAVELRSRDRDLRRSAESTNETPLNFSSGALLPTAPSLVSSRPSSSGPSPSKQSGDVG